MGQVVEPSVYEVGGRDSLRTRPGRCFEGDAGMAILGGRCMAINRILDVKGAVWAPVSKMNEDT